MEATQKYKMLAAALSMRGVPREIGEHILAVIENDAQIDDLTWFMGQNPKAEPNLLLAVTYQLIKDAKGGNN